MARSIFLLVFLALPLIFFCGVAAAQTCTSRGALDIPYCDEDHDLVADSPPVVQHKKPVRLVLGFAAYEDEAVTKQTYESFIADLRGCMKMPVSMFYAAREAMVIEALRTGKVHVAIFPTGATMFAVNMAGAVPFAARGKASENHPDNYRLILLVKSGSPYHNIRDLRGKKIAHTVPTSNSGNLAPRALFPALGLTPDRDYTVVFSGKHDKSIMGVGAGIYDAAAVASDVYARMIERKEIEEKDYRVLYMSESFPVDAFAHAHDLDAKLVGDLKKCFMDYKFSSQMSRALEGNDRFFPVTYQKDWELVRVVAKSAGQRVNREAYQKLLDAANMN